MATRLVTAVYGPNGHRQCVLYTWSGLLSGDEGEPIEIGAWADRSVQIQATFGDGTITLQGSNDGVNYHPLTDPQGNDIAKTAADLEQVTELPRYIKPTFSGTTGTAGVVTIFGRRVP